MDPTEALLQRISRRLNENVEEEEHEEQQPIQKQQTTRKKKRDNSHYSQEQREKMLKNLAKGREIARQNRLKKREQKGNNTLEIEKDQSQPKATSDVNEEVKQLREKLKSMESQLNGNKKQPEVTRSLPKQPDNNQRESQESSQVSQVKESEPQQDFVWI